MDRSIFETQQAELDRIRVQLFKAEELLGDILRLRLSSKTVRKLTLKYFERYTVTRTPIIARNLSVRTQNILRHAGIGTYEELATWTVADLLGRRNCGIATIQDINKHLKSINRKPMGN